MRSRAALFLLLTAALGIAALLVGRAFDERPLQQRLGVFPDLNVALLAKGHVACQGAIGTADKTSAVTFNPGTPYGERGPAIVATVRDHYSQRILARGRLAAGFDPAKAQTIQLSPSVKANQFVDFCFRNAGPYEMVLFGDKEAGSVHPTISTSVASIDGKPVLDSDIAMVFPRRPSKSVLEVVPQIFARASLFRPGYVGPWLLWLVAALILVAVPLLLARAVASAAADEDEGD